MARRFNGTHDPPPPKQAQAIPSDPLLYLPVPNKAGFGKRAYIPQEPTQETLMNAKHAEWLIEFSAYLALDTGMQMTVFRQGAITKLHWAGRYIEFIDKRNENLQARVVKMEARTREAETKNAELQAKVEELEKLQADAMAALRRAKDERDRAFDQPHHGHHDGGHQEG